jgi:hypothetical protein
MNTAVTYARAGRTVQVHYCNGEISGLREIESLGSIVQVRAGPWRERDTLKKTAPFFAYALDVGPKVYFGSATHDRAIGDRFDEERTQVEQVYIIYSRVPCFDRAMADQVEGHLVEFAIETGVPVLNKCLPFGRDGLTPNPGFEELMIDVRLMLAAAGFTCFDRLDGKTKRSKLSPVNTRINNVRYIEPEDWAVPRDAEPVRLVHRGLQAQGFMVGPRRIRVAPGADWCLTSKSGLSDDNRQRRQVLQEEGKIEAIQGDANRARLRVGLDCTPAIAAKLLSGEHIDSEVWQPVPTATASGKPEG